MTPQTWQEVLQARAWHRGAIEVVNEALSRASDAPSETIAILLEIQDEHTTAWTKLAGYQPCHYCGGDACEIPHPASNCPECSGRGLEETVLRLAPCPDCLPPHDYSTTCACCRGTRYIVEGPT